MTRRADAPRSSRAAPNRSAPRTPSSCWPRSTRWSAQGKDIVSFCIGQPDFPTPPNVQEAAIAAIEGGKHGYTPSAGIDELRAAAAKDMGARRGLDIRPDDVVVGAGAKPFIAYTIASVTDYGAGDEVIYPVPGFPIYESQILANGAVPVPIYLRESRDFAFDPAELEAKITPQTRAADPQHAAQPDRRHAASRPTSTPSPRSCARHPQVWVFADEIYSRLAYAGAFESLARRPGMLERTIICDGASKTWAMTGWRIGFAANRTLAPVFTRWITNTDSCASQISQWAAVEAMTGPQDAADGDARELPRAPRPHRRPAEHGARASTCRTPGGAFYAWPNVTEACRITGCADSEAFRKRLLTEAGVAVLADIHFGRRVPGDGQHIRFCYAASPEAIRDGVARLDAFVRRHAGRMTMVDANAMPHYLADNRASRDAILGRVRKALGKNGDRTRGARRRGGLRRRARARPASGACPPIWSRVPAAGDRHGRAPSSASPTAATFRPPSRATSTRSTCRRRSPRRSRTRASAGPSSPISTGRRRPAIEARPTPGDDRLGITGCFCAIAETGTLVVLSGADTPTATTLLPDTHVAVVRADRIVSGMEEAFALIRARARPPAARGQHDLGPVAHRRHRADDRGRRARAVPRPHPRRRLMIPLPLFALGIVALVAGAGLLVRGASRLALAFGISPLVVGLTVVAFGTSAPELAVSVGAAMRGSTDIAVGNVVGSNIFNVLFILGLSALITPLVVNAQVVRQEVPIMIGASLLRPPRGTA